MTPINVQDLWTVLQPYLPLLLTEAAKESGKKIPAAVGKLWTALKPRLERKPAAREALDDLSAAPADPDYQAALRVQMKKLLSEDVNFASQLADLLRAAQAERQYNANLHGDGAIAQGTGSTAVGSRGVYIGGDASNNTIITADDTDVNS